MRIAPLLLALLFAPACKKEASPAATSGDVIVDRVDDVAFVRLDTRALADLTPRDRALAYHLAQAALAGDSIFYDQTHRMHLALRGILSDLLQYRDALPDGIRDRVVDYAKRFWAQHGVYDSWTSEKAMPKLTFEELQRAVTAARDAGATFGLDDPLQVDRVLSEVRSLLFDRDVDRYAIQKSPPAGQDILTAAANNYYDGVRLADLKGFVERYALNSRLVKREGHLIEEVYRAGDGTVAPGLYAPQLSRVITHLRAAQSIADPDLVRVLGLLIRYLQTGEAADFRAYNVAWVHYNGPVDLILGFIENYGDPRGAKASFEGAVLVRDAERTAMMKALAANAGYYEQHMPWADMYKRPDVQPPVANAFEVVTETGDGGPFSPVGINLPNAQEIRQSEGSKSFFLTNIDAAQTAIFRERAVDEFAWNSEEASVAHRCSRWAWPALVAFHEVVGHGSGKVSPQLKGDPMESLLEYGSTLEEARADLVGLYQAHDAKTVEIGVLPDRGCADELIRGYVRSFVPTLRRIPTGDVVEEDHLRAEHLIVGTLLEKGAVERRSRDGKTFLVVPDVAKARAAAGELLAELMRIKATGDLPAIRTLVTRLATKLDTALRDEAVARTRAVGIPAQVAYISPHLEAVRDPQGAVTDARAVPPTDMAKYILAYHEDPL